MATKINKDMVLVSDGMCEDKLECKCKFLRKELCQVKIGLFPYSDELWDIVRGLNGFNGCLLQFKDESEIYAKSIIENTIDE